MRSKGLAAIAVLLVLVVAAGCSNGHPATTSPSPTQPVADLHWTGTTVTGSTFEGTSLNGKPALLWFWAPWCPICSSQIGTVKKLLGTYGKRVNVVGVGGLAASGWTKTGDEVLSGMTTIDDSQFGDVWQRFGVEQQATFIVVDSSGKITYNSTSDPESWTKVTSKVAAVAA